MTANLGAWTNKHPHGTAKTFISFHPVVQPWHFRAHIHYSLSLGLQELFLHPPRLNPQIFRANPEDFRKLRLKSYEQQFAA